ncbi:ATP-binding protein [Aeromonas salmonicida]|uniref:ATP-binding protein n=1 Tax=Aeromonas salmonicida TaxID=645 RepID=UPI00389A0FF9
MIRPHVDPGVISGNQRLRLEGIAAQWSVLAQKAANEEASFADYLEWLLHAEQNLRTERSRPNVAVANSSATRAA